MTILNAKQRQALARTLDDAERELAEARSEIDRLSNEVKKRNAQINQLVRQVTDFANEQVEYLDKNRALEASIDRLEGVIGGNEAALISLQEISLDKTDEIERLRQQVTRRNVPLEVHNRIVQLMAEAHVSATTGLREGIAALEDEVELKSLALRGTSESMGAEIERLRQQVTQRGARMQIMREWMRATDWQHFVDDHPRAADWFDEDGVPR